MSGSSWKALVWIALSELFALSLWFSASVIVMNILSVTRTIDDMGRILLPKDVRNALDVDENGLLLLVDRQQHIIRICKAGRRVQESKLKHLNRSERCSPRMGCILCDLRK
jgi:AbrB family looped-hinge helix DNA binding protein